MARFNPPRARLLLNDIDRSTRGQMAALDLEFVDTPQPRLRAMGHRLAVVRLGVRLALKALSPASNVFVDQDGFFRDEEGNEILEIAFTDNPLRMEVPRPSWSPLRWHIFVAGVVAGCLLCLLLKLITSS